VIERVELIGIDAAKECHRVGVPTPPKVVGKRVQGLKTGRKMGKDREGPDRTVRHERPQHPEMGKFEIR
jgi:hypothetical protein